MFDPVLVGAIITLLCGPLLTYFIAVKKFSGKIQTSEAADLWAESRAIRDWSKSRIEDLNERVKVLEASNSSFEQENRILIERIAQLNDTITKLREEITRLRGKLEMYESHDQERKE